MAPWALFAYAQSRPPRNRRRRIAWGVAVLAFCGVMLPLAVIGAIQGWVDGDVLDGLALTVLAVLMAGGLAAGVVGFVQLTREGRADSSGDVR